MTAYQMLVTAHIAAGSVALLTFWTAAIARKGSPLHVGVGKVYPGALLAVLVSALPMAAVFYASGYKQAVTRLKRMALGPLPKGTAS